jgi:hypothetical protein
MNETAINMLAGQGVAPRSIAELMGLDYEVVTGYLQAPRPGMTIIVWDLETSNLKSDIGTLLCGSFLDLATGDISTHIISDYPSESVRDREAQLVKDVRGAYAQADILVGFNSMAFDRNWLQGASARHGYGIDCLQVARHGLKGQLQSNSLENLADFFGVGVKDKPSKHEWREANSMDPEALAAIQQRCESDVRLTAAVWQPLRPYWLSWKGQS